MSPITPLRKKFFYVATASLALALAGCGGGNDDDPQPSGEVGALNITNATNTALNGWYGTTNLALTGVKDTGDGRVGPNVCAFSFQNINKVSGDRTLGMLGDIRYAYSNGSNTPPLNGQSIKIGESTYNFVKEGTNFSRASVNLTLGTITFNNLVARDGSNNTVEVSGVLRLPDATSRDDACNKTAG